MSVICLTFCTFAMHLGRKSKIMHSPLQREQSTTRGFVMEMNSLETQSSFSFCCTQLRPAGWLLTNRPKRNKNNKTKQNPRAWAATLGILESFASFSKSTFQLYNYLKNIKCTFFNSAVPLPGHISMHLREAWVPLSRNHYDRYHCSVHISELAFSGGILLKIS